MSSTVEQIKDRLGIAEVISSYIKLEKAGTNFRARCPFHQEKTPSFFVSPTRGSYHCFGCNRGGDILSFVQEIEGLDFMGALRILAERAQVPLDQIKVERDPEKDTLYAILESAKKYYTAELPRHGPMALEYLRVRGLTNETISSWNLGFAPAAWRGIYEHLRNQKFPDSLIEKAGLIIRKDDPRSLSHYYDRFRSRITFPLTDSSGRVIGFSGRIFSVPGGSAYSGGEPAKYINSPQTPVYDKGRFLFGYDKAKVAIRQKDQAVLVEGQFDLIMSHQAGVTNTVAVSGTALTRDHLAILSRLTQNLVMAFDGDKAGIAAASRAVALALGLGLEVRVARMPEGVDPADLILKDKTLWQERIGGAVHIVDFLLEVIRKRGLNQREMAHAIKLEVYPYLVHLRERIDRAHFIAKIVELTALPEQVISADLSDLIAGSELAQPFLQKEASPPKSRLELIDERLEGLRILHSDEELLLEIEDLKKEREQEFLKQELSLAVKNLTIAEKEKDEQKAREYLEQCQAISHKINDLKNKI